MGALLIVVSVLGGMVGLVLLVGRFDVTRLRRDVVVVGDRSVRLPGTIRFDVDRPLDGDPDASMTVGVAVTGADGAAPRCTLKTSAGSDVALGAPRLGSSLLNEHSGWTVTGEAVLAPGSYVLECGSPGEPSRAPSGATVTVGRTLGDDDVSSVVSTMLWLLAVGAVSGIMFLTGLVVLVVGLVRRARGGGGPDTPSIRWDAPGFRTGHGAQGPLVSHPPASAAPVLTAPYPPPPDERTAVPPDVPTVSPSDGPPAAEHPPQAPPPWTVPPGRG